MVEQAPVSRAPLVAARAVFTGAAVWGPNEDRRRSGPGLSPPLGVSIGHLSGVGALWDYVPRACGGGGGCAGGGVPLVGAVAALSWCGDVSLGGRQILGGGGDRHTRRSGRRMHTSRDTGGGCHGCTGGGCYGGETGAYAAA